MVGIKRLITAPINKETAEAFHKDFYRSLNWRKDLTYCGVPILKNPLDLHIIQEIIWETKPTLIIETGTAWGGSALFYRDLLNKIGQISLVVSIDDWSNGYVPKNYCRPERFGIEYMDMDALAAPNHRQLRAWAMHSDRVMVLLDSDHSMSHVLQECILYGEFVTPGCYMVVEDTNADAILPEFEGCGPLAATKEFMAFDKRFEVDSAREKFGFSFNMNGYLRRTK
jgi:cephalosporin hydroxylase